MKHTLRSVAIGVTAGVLAATGVTVAVAQIPSTDGTISACYVKPGGAVRVIDTEGGATCKKGESPLTWNQAGQPGQDGVSGFEVVSRNDLHPITDPITPSFVEVILCPEGKVAISGGANVSLEAHLGGSRPFGATNRGWALTARPAHSAAFTDGDSVGYVIEAVCVNALP